MRPKYLLLCLVLLIYLIIIIARYLYRCLIAVRINLNPPTRPISNSNHRLFLSLHLNLFTFLLLQRWHRLCFSLRSNFWILRTSSLLRNAMNSLKITLIPWDYWIRQLVLRGVPFSRFLESLSSSCWVTTYCIIHSVLIVPRFWRFRSPDATLIFDFPKLLQIIYFLRMVSFWTLARYFARPPIIA